LDKAFSLIDEGFLLWRRDFLLLKRFSLGEGIFSSSQRVFPWREGFSLGEGFFPLGEGFPSTFREFCRTSFQTAKRLGITPDEAAYRWLEFVESTKGRKALTTSRALGLVFKMKLEEVEREAKNRVSVEIIQLARRTYLYLLRHAKLSYLVHLAEVLGSLQWACELLGLIEGVEWFVPPSTGPPDEALAAA
jgi:hypothetical protein